MSVLAARIAALHAAGLDSRYDDVLLASKADWLDRELMSIGSHYNYQLQEWRDGHDHAHFVSNDDAALFLFCGADAVSCFGGEAQ